MSPKQIRNILVRNGFVSEELDSIEFQQDSAEIKVVDGGGDLDFDATEALSSRVGNVLGWEGYRCGYGAWVLSADYRASGLDYCDPANPIHY